MKTSKINNHESVNESANTNTNPKGVEGKSSANNQGETRKRVSETRSDWAVIENHTIALICLLTKGEKMPDKTEARKGFAFKSANGEGGAPHSRAYAWGLLAAFSSKKAGKVFAASKNEVLADDAKRESIALAIAVGTGLGKDTGNAKKLLSKAEKKRPKWLAEQVVAALG